MVVDTLIRQLLEAGVHFGHQTKRWNPKMKSFIFGERSSIYIIDLQQTAQRLKTACEFLKDLAAAGKSILFVGTKKQAQEIIAAEANRCEVFYVNERWLGGTLTNFQTVRKSVERLHELQAIRARETAGGLTKKEKASLDKEIARLLKKLAGIVQMKRLPSALVIVDPKKEEIAVNEASKLSIPVVALLDTNCDPDNIDYPIPGNDDALRSVKLIVSMLADAVLEGRKKYSGAKAVKKIEDQEKEKAETAEQEQVPPPEKPLIEEIEKKLKQPEHPQVKKGPKTEGKERK